MALWRSGQQPRSCFKVKWLSLHEKPDFQSVFLWKFPSKKKKNCPLLLPFFQSVLSPLCMYALLAQLSRASRSVTQKWEAGEHLAAKKCFTIRMVRHCHNLPQELMDVPSLEMSPFQLKLFYDLQGKLLSASSSWSRMSQRWDRIFFCVSYSHGLFLWSEVHIMEQHCS